MHLLSGRHVRLVAGLPGGLRGPRRCPELKEQLVTSGLALTAAARTLLETMATPPAPREPPDVEHIDLSDDGGEQPWD
uniref:Uncharacterized protein n=1 Tax=uncultured Nocardioidaceae bacterium TaxID=253824 RepID=A0A6J4MKD7_9ACTN|nr:MAG: hypothetical protein AVDCRST_MAG46-3334 [uncultured Nocardioidaceae bacterium]